MDGNAEPIHISERFYISAGFWPSRFHRDDLAHGECQMRAAKTEQDKHLRQAEESFSTCIYAYAERHFPFDADRFARDKASSNSLVGTMRGARLDADAVNLVS